MDKQPTEHRLKNDTLVNVGNRRGITAECVCGWKSVGHFSSMAASAVFQNHVELERGGHEEEEDDE